VVEGLGKAKGGVPDFFKVAVVEDEEVLVLVAQALDVVRDALGEVPDVALFELLGCPAAVLVDSGEEEGAFVDEAPFSLHVISRPSRRQVMDVDVPCSVTYNTMPVQLTDSTFLQVLLGTGDITALRQILDDLLADPAAWKEPCLGVGETPL
jgi:hypothetical protein